MGFCSLMLPLSWSWSFFTHETHPLDLPGIVCVCVRASVCLIIFAGAQRLRDGTVEKSNVVFCLRYCWQMELYRAIANVQQYTCNRTCIAHSYKHSYIHTFRIILVIRAFVHSHMYLHTYIQTDRQTYIHTSTCQGVP